MIRLFRCCYFLTGLLLCGCSQNTQDLTATMQSAFMGPESTSITPEAVSKLPYASLYVQQADNPLALMILVWAEPTQTTSPSSALKWLSAKREMLVTQSGRIIKTVNMRDGNLTALTSDQPDPLALGLQKGTTPHRWQYQISWLPGYHSNYQAESTFMVGNLVNKQLPAGEQSLLYVREDVEILQLGQHYQNHYWLNPQNGHVVASEQYIFPGSAKMTLSIGKPYAGENNE